MSNQDNQFCEKCKRPCGYDDAKGHFDPGYLCGECKKNMMKRYLAFFGLEGGSGSEFGFEITWRDIDGILSKVKRGYDMKVSYIVTDKECCERTQRVMIPVEES